MLPRPPADIGDYDKDCAEQSAPPASSHLFATTRLADCRIADRIATNFRATQLTYGSWDGYGLRFYSPSKWTDELVRRIKAPPKPPILYIHGYNNTNLDGLARGAAISQATGREVIVLTWPSYGGLTKYFWDEANAEWSMPEARALLDQLAAARPELIVIAHSMGNRIAVDMLQSWRARAPQGTLPIEQLIMASPDVDRAWFLKEFSHDLGVPVTLYGSTKDQPLSASWRSHGYARAGDLSRWVTGNDTDYPLDKAVGVTVVDTSEVSYRLGHADFVETAQGAADLCRVVNEQPTSAGRDATPGHPTNWRLLKVPNGEDDCSNAGRQAAAYLGNRLAKLRQNK